MTTPRQIPSVPVSASETDAWIRQAAPAINNLLAGGPHAPLWKSIYLSATSSRLGGGNTEPSWTTFIGGTGAYSFSASQMNQIFAAASVPHDYAIGSPIILALEWTANTSSTNTVRWGIEYTAARSHQQSVFPATSTIYQEQAFAGTPYMLHATGLSSDVSGSILVEPDTLSNMRIFRDAPHANDDLPSAAYLLGLRILYQANLFGTPQAIPPFYSLQAP